MNRKKTWLDIDFKTKPSQIKMTIEFILHMPKMIEEPQVSIFFLGLEKCQLDKN